MDILAGLQVQIDIFYYNLLLSLAGLHWSLLRGFIMMGYTIEVINRWLVDNAFAPLIGQTNASLSVAVSFAFIIALFVLGLTYLLAAFIRLEVVNFRSALTWYVAGALFFTLGPSLYQGMNSFRTTVAQGFYLSTLTGLQDNTGNTFNSLDNVSTSELDIFTLCDNLGTYIEGATQPQGIDGLDVALAYLRADGIDVMGYHPAYRDPACPQHPPDQDTGLYTAGQIPYEWKRPGSYFDLETSFITFESVEPEDRADSISMASTAHSRLLTAWPLVIFGVVEQLVYLLITIAMGITFISFSLAILFAFFKKTEVIAKSIIDQWIELIVQTVVIAMVQSLVVAFFLAGTASGNGMVTLGIGLICLIFMLIVLWSGVKAVWNSLNRLFNAMGKATGGVILSPGKALTTAAGASATAVGAGVSVGSNALAGMSALQQGATLAQAAGISFGGFRSLSGAARTLAYLPGVRNTSLGDAAEQFTEGSITRQVARNIPVVGRAAGPILGAKLLTDRDPDKAEYDEQGRVINRPMLIPAVGEGLERWTVPRGKSRRAGAASSDEFVEDENGDMMPMGSFTPARSRRMGTFTPVMPQETSNQRHEYADEMQGEEMEQHIADVMRSSTNVASPLVNMLEDDASGDGEQLNQVAQRLESSAGMLARAAQTMMIGQLRVAGVPDVASVMGDVVGQVQDERQQAGQSASQGIDHLQAADRMAQVMGVRPQADSGAPIQRDLARFGLFLDQALKLGLSPQQTEQVIREVQSSPESRMQPTTRESLDKQVQGTGNLSWLKARDQVDKLEHSARMLPPEITAYGAVAVPTPSEQTILVNVSTSEGSHHE